MSATAEKIHNTQYVRNILKVYRSATPEQIAAGTEWYGRARAIAEEITPDNFMVGAGIIAALSPMMPWNRNVELARKCVANNGLTGGALSKNVHKANLIFKGQSIGLVPLDVLSGDKVRAFYAAIVGNGDIVTIDRHAYAIAANKPFTKKVTIGKKLYRTMNASYIRAAKLEGIDVHALQAITWLTYRANKGIVD